MIAVASGLFFGCATKCAQSSNSLQSQRSRTKASSTRPSVTMTCASAVITATLVPGISGRCSALTCGDFHHLGAARIDHDQLGALAQPLLQARGEHRMGGGRVGADDHDDVGVLDRVEILRAGRGAEGGRQAVAGRRVADAGAGVDIVVAEAGADQLLHQIGFFVGAARRGDAADGVAAVLRLDAA